MCSLMQANPPSLPVPTKALQTESAESVRERMRLQKVQQGDPIQACPGLQEAGR